MDRWDQSQWVQVTLALTAVKLTHHLGEGRPYYQPPLFPRMKILQFLHLVTVDLQWITIPHMMAHRPTKVDGTEESLWGRALWTSTPLALLPITEEGLLSEIPSELVLLLPTEALLHSRTILKMPLGRDMVEIQCKVHNSLVFVGVVVTNYHRKCLQGGNKMRGLLEECSRPTTQVIVSIIMITEATTSRALSVTVTHSQVLHGLHQTPTTMECSTSL